LSMASKKSDNIQDPAPEKSNAGKPPRVSSAGSSGKAMENAARHARRTFSKMTYTAKAIAAKVTRSKTHSTRSAPAATAAGRLDKTMTPSRSKSTRVSALAPGVTTQDVQAALLESHSSPANHNPETPPDLKEQFFHDQNRQADSSPEAT